MAINGAIPTARGVPPLTLVYKLLLLFLIIQLNSSVKIADIMNDRMISVYIGSPVLKIRDGAILNLLIFQFTHIYLIKNYGFECKKFKESVNL
jgi:hypothetical protein